MALAELRAILPHGQPGRIVNSFIFEEHEDALEYQKFKIHFDKEILFELDIVRNFLFLEHGTPEIEEKQISCFNSFFQIRGTNTHDTYLIPAVCENVLNFYNFLLETLWSRLILHLMHMDEYEELENFAVEESIPTFEFFIDNLLEASFERNYYIYEDTYFF